MLTKNNNFNPDGSLIDHQFPFHDLNDSELSRTTGSWVYRSSDRLKGKLDMYRDILESPDKNDPSEYMHETCFESNYYSIKKSGILFKNAAKQKGFSLLHCNTRSLGKNVSLLHDILLTVETRPDIIAISETKINENSYANINLPGYNFVNTNSKSQAGGVSLYIANNVEFSRKTDLDISHDGIESCWVELACHKQKNIVIGCVYRHPKSDRSLFYETLKKQLHILNSKGRR